MGCEYAAAGFTIDIHSQLGHALKSGLRQVHSYAIRVLWTAAVVLREPGIINYIIRPNDWLILWQFLIYIKYLLEKTHLYLELTSKSPRLELNTVSGCFLAAYGIRIRPDFVRYKLTFIEVELMPWSETYRSYEESEKRRSAELFVPESQKRPYYRPWQEKAKGKSKKSQLAASWSSFIKQPFFRVLKNR